MKTTNIDINHLIDVYFVLIILSISIICFDLKKGISNNLKLILILIAGWLLFYTFYSQVLTGIISLITAILVITSIHLYRKNKLILIGICSIKCTVY